MKPMASNILWTILYMLTVLGIAVLVGYIAAEILALIYEKNQWL